MAPFVFFFVFRNFCGRRKNWWETKKSSHRKSTGSLRNSCVSATISDFGENLAFGRKSRISAKISDFAENLKSQRKSRVSAKISFGAIYYWSYLLEDAISASSYRIVLPFSLANEVGAIEGVSTLGKTRGGGACPPPEFFPELLTLHQVVPTSLAKQKGNIP